MKYRYLFLYISGNSNSHYGFNEDDKIVENGESVIESCPSDTYFLCIKVAG